MRFAAVKGQNDKDVSSHKNYSSRGTWYGPATIFCSGRTIVMLAMRGIFVASLACLFGTLPALADNNGGRVWAPGPAAIQKVEAAIGPTVNFAGAKCPPQKLKDFARYYYGITDTDDHPIIIGQLLLAKDWPGRQAGVHIQASGITGGSACSIANVWFDAETSELVYAFWGGR